MLKIAPFESIRLFFFWLLPAACRNLVPRPGIDAPAVEVKNPNQWAAREFPHLFTFIIKILDTKLRLWKEQFLKIILRSI